MEATGFVKLSDENLQRQPEEVFDLLEKLGEGSYGAVYKAMHKESGELIAIKKVPVDSDLQEIIKEISIMQQCDSPYVVRYYGSYFKDQDLWIVMEYCGAGSVSDIMKACRKTLTEPETATILQATLKGLEYLHFKRKIHRDIKAGNILLNSSGHAKLADFGVAGQLSDTMAKRNTVIGTPFWMAPEVIQEVGYDCRADIWSVGITAIEMVEGKPPYADIHPMRAIFMIPSKPPPKFKDEDRWTPGFRDFLEQCVVKNPEERATATSLLQHDFIKNASTSNSLKTMIEEAMHLMKEAQEASDGEGDGEDDDDDDDENTGTMVISSSVPDVSSSGTMVTKSSSDDDMSTGTMVMNSGSMVIKPMSDTGTMVLNGDEDDGSSCGTMVMNTDSMVINSDSMVITDTMKCVSDGTTQVSGGNDRKKDYRPSFMDHFDNMSAEEQREIAPVKQVPTTSDFEMLGKRSYSELKERLAQLDPDMEREIEELRRRYQSKRQPILDAMDAKRRRQAEQK
ncbi:serine/threonine-protein kinase 4-like [Sycon ciliatum]|uniref:serine/threonine-protein kinase 4-like n=1 Tax=Sycon ciliatum TaxID=27933 RepID=UPI0020AB1564